MTTQRVYGDEVREKAVKLAGEIGVAAAARELGLSYKQVYVWTHPDYAQRCRDRSLAAKQRRRRPCMRGCGRTCSYDNEDGVCTRCRSAESAVWTREAIIEAIKAYAAQYGRPPSAMNWNAAQARARGRDDLSTRFHARGRCPATGTVINVFGSWNAAIKAAGYTPLQPGHKYADARPERG